MGRLRRSVTSMEPNDAKPESDFEDIKQAFDAELEEMAKKTDNAEKRKEIISALRGK